MYILVICSSPLVLQVFLHQNISLLQEREEQLQRSEVNLTAQLRLQEGNQ